MADDLNIGRHFFEYSDHGRLPHYDIPADRIPEITAKCNLISQSELVVIIHNGLKKLKDHER